MRPEGSPEFAPPFEQMGDLGCDGVRLEKKSGCGKLHRSDVKHEAYQFRKWFISLNNENQQAHGACVAL